MRARSGGVSAAAPAFSPSDISGLKLWLDASDATTITSSGGSVSQWNDKSGNNNNVLQSTGTSQPTTGVSTIGGKNAISFDGNDFLTFTTSIAPTTSMYYFIVFKCTASANLQAFLGCDDAGGPVFRINASEQAQIVRKGQAVLMTSSTVLSDNNDYILTAVTKTTLNRTRTNGVLDSGETTTNPSYTQNMDRIGTESLSNFLVSKIGEILIYTTEPSDADKNRLGQYAQTKWGITWTNI